MSLIWLILLKSALFSSELMTRFWNQKVQFSRKTSINFYKKAILKTIPKKLFLTFPDMYFPILRRSSLRKVWTFVFHLRNLSMPTIWSILNWINRDIRNLEILSNKDLDFVKTKTKETALSSFRQCNKIPQQNLSKEELAALTNLSKKQGYRGSKIWQR